MLGLLDSKARAAKAEKRYLRPFLDKLISMVKDVNKLAKLSGTEVRAYGYPVLGAVNYLLISKSTQSGLWSKVHRDDKS